MMNLRTVWRTQKAGKLADVRCVTEQELPLQKGEIRIDVRAVGLNFADIFALTGLYSATPEGSFIPGLEFAGVVREVGPDVDEQWIGRSVMGCCRFGAYASSINVAVHQIQLLPEGWTFAQGAAFLVQSFTALYALRDLAALKSGQLVLIHSAAGGVGLQALQIARAMGVNVIGTVSQADKKTFVEQQHLTECWVREPDFSAQLKRELNGRALHAVLDAIGGDVQRASFDAMASCGRLVVFGAAEYAPGKNRPNWLKMAWLYWRRPRYDALSMISENKSVMAFNLIWLWQNQTLFSEMFDALMALKLAAPHVGHRFPFEQAPAAIECLRSGRTIGKVVLELC